LRFRLSMEIVSVTAFYDLYHEIWFVSVKLLKI